MQHIDPGDQVRLADPDKYCGTKPGDVYTAIRLAYEFVEIKSPDGSYLTVELRDLYHA